MKDHVFMVDASGDLDGLYTDIVDLRSLGTLNVERASHVEFDNEHQGWTVSFSDGQSLCRVFTSRDEALAAEVVYLQSRL